MNDNGVAAIDAFTGHLDDCRQCHEHPFGLCVIGLQLLEAAAKLVPAKLKTRCQMFAERTLTTTDWVARHRDHGDLGEEPFEHPTGTWRALVCTGCGAKHVTDQPTVPGKRP